MSDSLVIADTRIKTITEIVTRATGKHSGLYEDETGNADVLGPETAADWLLDVISDYFSDSKATIEGFQKLLNKTASHWRLDDPTENLTDYARAFDATGDAFIQEIVTLVNSPLPATEEEAIVELWTARLEAVKATVTRINEHSISEYESDYAIALDKGAKGAVVLVSNALDASASNVHETVAKVRSSLSFARNLADEIGYDTDLDSDTGMAKGYDTVANEISRLVPRS